QRQMVAQYIVFGVFSLCTLLGAALTVWSRNLFHSALWLVVSLFGVAGLFVLLSAPFLAAIQILVYIGAIAILFIFAVMLTRSLTADTIGELFTKQWWVGAFAGAALFGALLFGVVLPVWGPNGTMPNQPLSVNVAETRDIGLALVSGNGFVLPFEVASLLLTAAMVGAIVIAREDEQ
ncbi:MAG: NADH-quinone oxidoreductase subunit J, partial [Chloroflexota bacterium]